MEEFESREWKERKKKKKKKKTRTKIIKLVKRIVISSEISSKIFPQLLKFARIWRKCGSIVEYTI